MTGTVPPPEVGEKNSTGDPKYIAAIKVLNDGLNSENKILNSFLASPGSSVYRTLATGDGYYNEGSAATLYFNRAAEMQLLESTRGVVLFQFAKADYEVSGATQKLRLRVQLETNGTAPSRTFTVGMYPVTGISAGTYTVGAAVTGSTVAFASPSANTLSQGNSGDFAIPSDGPFVFGVALSGATPGGSKSAIHIQLQTHHT
jgi:hypothetical protein